MNTTQVTSGMTARSNASIALLDQPFVNQALSLVGRLAIAYLFCFAAFFHLTFGFAGTVKDMAAHGVPMPAVVNIVAMIVSSASAVALVFNFKARWAALLLALYVIVVSTVMYGPFNADWETTRVLFMKDMAIFGALLAWSSSLTNSKL